MASIRSHLALRKYPKCYNANMLKSIRTVVSQFWQITRTPIVTQLITIVIEGAFLVFIFYLWQTYILPAEQGIYSPFQSGLSLIRYIGLVVIINIGISLSAIKRNILWIWLPLLANFFLLGLSIYYVVAIIRQ